MKRGSAFFFFLKKKARSCGDDTLGTLHEACLLFSILQVTLLPDDLGVVARNWVELFAVLLGVLEFEQVFNEHVLVG